MFQISFFFCLWDSASAARKQTPTTETPKPTNLANPGYIKMRNCHHKETTTSAQGQLALFAFSECRITRPKMKISIEQTSETLTAEIKQSFENTIQKQTEAIRQFY